MNTNSLKEIISSFDEKELKALQKYLEAFNGTFGEHHVTKLSHLLLLICDKEKTDTEIETELGVKGDAFRKLKDRLKDKAFDTLLLDVNVKRVGAFPDTFKSFIDAKQDYVKARIALSKGLENEAWKFINKGIRKSKEYEVYSDLLELLYLKQRFVNLRQGKSAFDKVEKEIAFYEKCRMAYNRSARFSELLHQRVGFNNSKQENQKFLEDCIKEMKSDYKLTNSPFVKQKILLFEMQYFEEQDKFSKCLKVSYDSIVFLKENKKFSAKNEIGAAYLNAARYHIILKEYDKASICADFCKNHFTENTYAYSYSLELSFYIKFYQKQYESGLVILNDLLTNPHYNQWEYQSEKWNYLQSCTYFQLGEYKRVNKIITKQYPELEKDNDGWGVYLKIMRVMCLIERKQYDMADASIDQLQYFLKKKQPKARIKTIEKLLVQLKNTGYNFKEVKEDKSLKKLSSDKGWYQKQNMEAELVWFDDWILRIKK
jgi:hypothetical protein